MSQRKQIKSYNFILSLLRGIRIRCQRITRNLMRSLLRSWMILNRRDRYGRSGFVLPTVTMVLLVVVLLTIAITFRAFDRAKEAQYNRVSQRTLTTAAPALDRARAKIIKVMRDIDQDPTRRPSNTDLYNALTQTNIYKFDDEDILSVRYDLNGDGSIQENGNEAPNQGKLSTKDTDLTNNEQLTTAWRFPVDTDNNGKFDSYTFYSILLRTPNLGEKRSPLEARSNPMPPFGEKIIEGCEFASGASDNLLTPEGWTPIKGKLKKSIFVYTLTVPIKVDPNKDDFEEFKGATSYSPLEYQQDWSQKPLNGVVYRNDLEITPGLAFNLNSPLLSVSNLIVSHFGSGLKIYQVTSKNSCYYDPDTSKITVGGNVINGMVGNNNTANIRDVEVHLFQGTTDNPLTTNISQKDAQSIDEGAYEGMYNDAAYEQRLNALVEAQLENASSSDPPDVQKIVAAALVDDPTKTEEQARREQLQQYFANRLRRVPFAEVPLDGDGTGGNTNPLQGSGATLRPPDAWIYPIKDGTTTSLTNVKVKLDKLEATEPEKQIGENQGYEAYLGDRVKVGNNLPALMLKTIAGQETWIPGQIEMPGDEWTDPVDAADNERMRVTEAEDLPPGGDISRDGFWEKAAAQKPATEFAGVGGLRVVTGAGVYERPLDATKQTSFLPPPKAGTSTTYDDPATSATETYPIVWPDTMPMSPAPKSKIYNGSAWVDVATLTAANLTPPAGSIDPNTPRYAKGDLKMRATAVYHYAQDVFNPPGDLEQRPIACVSSYYDPSNSVTAQNMAKFPTTTDLADGGFGISANGKSNNGVSYPPPKTARPTSATFASATGLFTVSGAAAELGTQANYVFPDGRFANEPLRKALQKLVDGDDLSLAEQGAIDSTLCSLDILSGSIKPSNTVIPDSAIREVALLNAREVKAVDKDDPTTTVDETMTINGGWDTATKAKLTGKYDLALEDRQPLEIRVTQLDLNLLRNNDIPNTTTNLSRLNPEYLLPYSGVVYASRDDALPDRSFREGNATSGVNEEKSKALSSTDYRLDPSRRPNGIMLINGRSLGRNNNQTAGDVQDLLKEKGLTLVSNLPVYIKAEKFDANLGGFNDHTQDEFSGTFSWDFNTFYTRSKDDRNYNFACRKNDPIRKDFEAKYQCPDGDNWRPATVIADAITLLSDDFRFGFRDEGDFDLRNNAANAVNAVMGYDLNMDGDIQDTDPPEKESTFGIDLNGNGKIGTTIAEENVKETEVTAKAARQLNGFNAYNDFAINGLSSGAKFQTHATAVTYTDAPYRAYNNNALDSSYFNNFVTPVQRRGTFSEYVMEVCPKLPVSACGPEDWVLFNDTGTTSVKASSINLDDTTADPFNNTNNGGGTTAKAPLLVDLQRFPRRVAFQRDSSNKLKLDSNNRPIPLGIKGGNIIKATFADTSTTPDTPANALWFQTRGVNSNTAKNWGSASPLWYYDPANPNTSKTFTVATVQQPLLVPVLQIHASTNQPGGNVGNFPVGTQLSTTFSTRWLPRPARNTEFNLVLGAGDVPGRPGESNGGLQNLPRFLENWQDPTPSKNTNISGSFVQAGRSTYATAPYITTTAADSKIFGNTAVYNVNNAAGRLPYFMPPDRNWGFDVGLLSQPPDYFARTFARLESKTDAETGEKTYKIEQYYREVNKDDPWVKALLCAKDENGTDNAADEEVRPKDCSKKHGT